MTDGSLTSQVEDWIVSTIAGHDDVSAEYVEAFEGIENYAGSIDEIAKDLMSKPPKLWMAVRWMRTEYRREPDDQHDASSFYLIYTAVRNSRPGASRRGDESWAGINRYREILWELFNRDTARPGKRSVGVGAGFCTEDVHIVSSELADLLPENFSMMLTVLEVIETTIVE